MDRLPGIALTAVGVTAVVGLAVNGGPLLPVVLVAGGAAVLALQRLTLRPVRDVEWGVAGADAAAWAPLPALPLGAGEARRPAPSTGRRLAAALARVESGQLARSPWVAAGIGFCLIIVALLGWAMAGDSNLPWRDIIANFPVMAHPLVGMVVVATHSAVTRARRDGAGELFDSCPLPPSTRTAGHLLTAWVPVATLGLFMATYVVVLAVRAPFNYGPIDGTAAGDVAAALALGVGGVALGVALGRWAPWRLVPIAAVFALLQPIVAIGNVGEPHWSNTRQLSSWPRYPNHDLLFTIRPVWWHLVWLLALAAIVGCVALANTGWRPVAIPLAAAALLATVAGLAETRPLGDGQAARLASMVAEPERHQACASTGPARVCAFGGYGRFASVMAAEAAPVMAAVPEPAPAVVVRQVFDGDLRALGPEVAEALHGRGVGGGPAAVRVFDINRETRSAVRLTTALAAVGLPARPPATKVPVLVAGQARGVLAIWLAARGLPAGEAVRLATAFHPTDPHDPANFRQGSRQALGSAWPDACSAGPPPVAWAPEDLAAARAVLALPEADVARVVRARWAELTDPSATTDDLLRAVGLDPTGPPPSVIVGPVECTY